MLEGKTPCIFSCQKYNKLITDGAKHQPRFCERREHITMTKRIFALLLVLAMLCGLVPAVLAAPSPVSTVNVTADLAYDLKGLKYNTVIQNFYIDTDYIYVTQSAGSGTFYLSRLKISGKTATYVDHMTLTNCGNGESLAGYHYNGKLYFFIGAKGLEATNYGSTQIARIRY